MWSVRIDKHYHKTGGSCLMQGLVGPKGRVKQYLKEGISRADERAKQYLKEGLSST
jgi:hypothetical protein